MSIARLVSFVPLLTNEGLNHPLFLRRAHELNYVPTAPKNETRFLPQGGLPSDPIVSELKDPGTAVVVNVGTLHDGPDAVTKLRSAASQAGLTAKETAGRLFVIFRNPKSQIILDTV